MSKHCSFAEWTLYLSLFLLSFPLLGSDLEKLFDSLSRLAEIENSELMDRDVGGGLLYIKVEFDRRTRAYSQHFQVPRNFRKLAQEDFNELRAISAEEWYFTLCVDEGYKDIDPLILSSGIEFKYYYHNQFGDLLGGYAIELDYLCI